MELDREQEGNEWPASKGQTLEMVLQDKELPGPHLPSAGDKIKVA